MKFTYPLLILVAWVTLSTGVRAQSSDLLEIHITQGTESALPIAIVPFDWQADVSPTIDVSSVVSADLLSSGRFAPMPVADLPSRPASFTDINFKDWRLLGMDNLVIGQIKQTAADRFAIEFRVIDAISSKQLAGFRIPTTDKNLRLTAHHISDLIYEAILKVKGAFATRIAYVTVEKVSKNKSRYQLQIADSDGYNARTILESREPLLSPAWSPLGDRLAYVSFEDGNSAIYVQDIRTGNREKVAFGRGINSAPAFSPDGNRLLMTRSRDGNPDIFLMDLKTKKRRRLTEHPAIDTEARWTPDARHIVFTSDRGGGPQIYRLAIAGGKPERLTFNMGDYNSRATLSPDGKRMAVVNGGDKGYRIALLDLEKNRFDFLTDARLDESPSFAPNGAMVIYATMGVTGAELAVVSVDGRVRQRLALQKGEVREPAWGPIRK
ncbi:MAG: Tol-Pal system beta propeller repeat protein TolB [Gammaproteobacteria bacterium]